MRRDQYRINARAELLLPPACAHQPLRISESERDVESNEGSEVEGIARERKAWSAKEDKELLKQVSLHGEGKWKVILDNSRILSEWCAQAGGKSVLLEHCFDTDLI